MSMIDPLQGQSVESLQGPSAGSLQGAGAGTMQGRSAESLQGARADSMHGVSVASILDDAVRRLGKDQRGVGPLPSRPAVGSRPGAVSRSRTPSSTSSGSGSINEIDYTLREYYPERLVTSSDGFVVLRVKPIKRVAIEDGQFMTFQQPPAP